MAQTAVFGQARIVNVVGPSSKTEVDNTEGSPINLSGTKHYYMILYIIWDCVKIFEARSIYSCCFLIYPKPKQKVALLNFSPSQQMLYVLLFFISYFFKSLKG